MIDRVERTNDFRLPVAPNVAIALKCCEHVLVAEVLRPGFVLLGCILGPREAPTFFEMWGLK
jgi:hypothetical protein